MTAFATVGNLEFNFNEKNQCIIVNNGEKTWEQDENFEPYIQIQDGDKTITLLLKDAIDIKSEPILSGIAKGFCTRYNSWRVAGKLITLSIETTAWVHMSSGRLYFEIMPLNEVVQIKQAVWPAPWKWEVKDEKAYSVFPLHQGVLVPSNFENEVKGCGYWSFCEVGSPMPWFGQIDNGYGCLQIITTPWDCGHRFFHPAGGPTEFYPIWRPSLGGLRYKRTIRVEFFVNSDYNTFCKSYRTYIKEQGKLLTLAQKEISNPKIADLIGSPVIHSQIYYYVKPEAFIYQKDKPEENYKFATFEHRRLQIEALAKRGLKKAYLHLDGWGVDGYDQQHPDILPPCEKAGGAEKMRELAQSCKDNHVLFALHDQYRDYYLDAQSYDEKNVMRDATSVIPRECTWNGGEQNVLCTTLAPFYVDRNYRELEKMGIKPDGVYLDVFSCVQLDECFDTEHPMTRKECIDYRANCMEILRSRGMILSSETAVDTMIPHIELCHYAPYISQVGDYNVGVAVPLLNLVYHDCIVTPWIIRDSKTGKIDAKQYLQPILNGNPAYLDIEADDEELQMVKVVTDLQEKVARCEMLKHEFLNEERTVEKTTFSNGITVTVNFNENTYLIQEDSVMPMAK